MYCKVDCWMCNDNKCDLVVLNCICKFIEVLVVPSMTEDYRVYLAFYINLSVTYLMLITLVTQQLSSIMDRNRSALLEHYDHKVLIIILRTKCKVSFALSYE